MIVAVVESKYIFTPRTIIIEINWCGLTSLQYCTTALVHWCTTALVHWCTSAHLHCT
jgi:hypothetical protein